MAWRSTRRFRMNAPKIYTAPHWLICAQVKANSVFMEDEFAKLGAVFKKGDPWTAHVCKAGNLITAQNPQSADACAAAVIAALA